MPLGKIKTEIKPYARSMSSGALALTHSLILPTHKRIQRWCNIRKQQIMKV